MIGEIIMPTLEEFREKQKMVEAKKNKPSFKPKRYAPYLLQEEIINYARLQKKNKDITQEIESEFNELPKVSDTESFEKEVVDNNKKIKDSPSEKISHHDYKTAKPEIIARLYGIRKKLMFFFVDLCEARGKLDTGPITAETLIEASGSTYKTIKKVLQIMIEDSLIKRMQGKRGKGGFSVLLISKEIKESVLKYKKIIMPEPSNTKNNISSAERTNFVTNNLNDLPEVWKEIDLKPLKNIGFSETQLKQLFTKNLNVPEVVQESIYQFAFGLEHNPKTKEYNKEGKNPLNVLMGVLRSGGQWTENDYETPQQRSLRILLEVRKKRKEQQDIMINELLDIEFPAWERKLDDKKRNEIVPEQLRSSKLSRAMTACLRSYFLKNVLLPRLEEEGLLA